jgi:hypothetical protein
MGDGVAVEPDWDWQRNPHPTMGLISASIGDEHERRF